jgi:hypothetical protein
MMAPERAAQRVGFCVQMCPPSRDFLEKRTIGPQLNATSNLACPARTTAAVRLVAHRLRITLRDVLVDKRHLELGWRISYYDLGLASRQSLFLVVDLLRDGLEHDVLALSREDPRARSLKDASPAAHYVRFVRIEEWSMGWGL